MSNKSKNRESLLKLKSTHPTFKYSNAINKINTANITNIHIKQLLQIYKNIYFYQRIFNKLTFPGKQLHIILIKKDVAKAIQIFKLLFSKGIKNNDEYDMIIVLQQNILKALIGIQKQVKTYKKNNIDNYDLNMNQTIKNAYEMRTEMNNDLNQQIKDMKLGSNSELNPRKRSKTMKRMNTWNE